MNIRILHEFEGGIEKSVLRITDWHHDDVTGRRAASVRLFVFYLSQGLVQVCEIEIYHMGKNNGNPIWCARKRNSWHVGKFNAFDVFRDFFQEYLFQIILKYHGVGYDTSI